MKLSDKKRSRELLRNFVAEQDPAAVEYIDWDAFEGVLDAVMASESGQDPDAIMQVFKSVRNKAVSAKFFDRPPGPTN